MNNAYSAYISNYSDNLAMSLIKIRKNIVCYISILCVIGICYQVLVGKHREEMFVETEEHFMDVEVEENDKNRKEEDINVFIILCIKLDVSDRSSVDHVRCNHYHVKQCNGYNQTVYC